MRSCRRNKQTIYYINQVSTTMEQVDGYDTGNIIPVYSDLITRQVNVSPATGQAAIELFGNENRYDKLIVVLKGEELNVAENTTKFFIDVTPNNDKTNYNYICKKIANSLNVIAYALTSIESTSITETENSTPTVIENNQEIEENENVGDTVNG